MDMPDCFMDNQDNFIGQHQTLLVLPNGFPITSLHLLLVTAEHREQLRKEDIQSALDFARTFPDFLVFHNMRHAGATRPEHVHFQAVLRDEALPIETAPRKELLSLPGAAVLTRLEDYPVYSLAIQGARAAETTFVLVRELRATPFNLVVRPEEVLIVPRTRAQPAGFPTMFGGLEMAGCVVLVDEERYGQLGYDDIRQSLAECGFDVEAQEKFEEKLLAHLALAFDTRPRRQPHQHAGKVYMQG